MSTPNNLTPRAQQALVLAAIAAKQLNHSYVGTEHLLIGLIDLGQGGALAAMRKVGITPIALRKVVYDELGAVPQTASPTVTAQLKPVALTHYLLFDQDVQWFAAVASFNGDASHDTLVAFIDMSSSLWNVPFLSNLTSREPAFTRKQIRDHDWMGWSISEAEADRVRKVVSLRSTVDEYNRLVSYP